MRNHNKCSKIRNSRLVKLSDEFVNEQRFLFYMFDYIFGTVLVLPLNQLLPGAKRNTWAYCVSKMRNSDIQKIFLDVHTSRAHVANNPVSFSRNYGAMQLGVENTDYFV